MKRINLESSQQILDRIIELESAIKKNELSVEEVERMKEECIALIENYQYNTMNHIIYSDTTNGEITIQQLQNKITNYQEVELPKLNKELQVEKKYKEFKEEYNTISEHLLEKPSTIELLQNYNQSVEALQKLEDTYRENQRKIEYYEKQMQLLFKTTNDLLDYNFK
ncbi:hypothetical protein ABK040_005148 [Willaertia magna]